MKSDKFKAQTINTVILETIEDGDKVRIKSLDYPCLTNEQLTEVMRGFKFFNNTFGKGNREKVIYTDYQNRRVPKKITTNFDSGRIVIRTFEYVQYDPFELGFREKEIFENVCVWEDLDNDRIKIIAMIDGEQKFLIMNRKTGKVIG